LSIANPAQTQPRLITVDDMLSLRRVDALSVSPDGRHVAAFLRQADAVENTFRTAWWIVDVDTGAKVCAGSGGEVRFTVAPNGRVLGTVEVPQSHWSPDGRWLAYTLRADGAVQLWMSSADGSTQEQLTRNSADVRDFAWKHDGTALYFSVGATRQELLAQERHRERSGYQYDDDLYAFTDFMLPVIGRASGEADALWIVTTADRRERPANGSEQSEFDQLTAKLAAADVRLDGRRDERTHARLIRDEATSMSAHIAVATRATGFKEVTCRETQCSGVIQQLWWDEREENLLFWRREGLGSAASGFYALSVRHGKVHQIFRSSNDDSFRLCEKAARDTLVCVRETATLPADITTMDGRTGKLRVLAEVNSGFDSIRLGRVERFEWDTPSFPWNENGGRLAGLYPQRAFGYILYPPDFDPSRKYPVFISPYAAVGFDNETNLENPLHVYAASGFIVLNTNFPMPADVVQRLGPDYMKQLYSQELGYPHLSMLSESTLKALDEVARRGFVDETKVGIGGVSHGAFVPLYILQQHDRIAAVSVSGTAWGSFEYYWQTRRGRGLAGGSRTSVNDDWKLRPAGRGQDFWSGFDLADHVGAIEAPILMNLPATETYGMLRLIRHLADAGKPYDAYVFPRETHIKWQPAHLQSIMQRNVDWFRFWLQGYEDAAPAKQEQYERWRKLREVQDRCKFVAACASE
jgi:dipeptidyl aminopeptidase/acylaminoacyl peptidase